jgi:hypothetical protein
MNLFLGSEDENSTRFTMLFAWSCGDLPGDIAFEMGRGGELKTSTPIAFGEVCELRDSRSN